MQKHKIVQIIIIIAVILFVIIGYVIIKRPKGYSPEGYSEETYLQEQERIEEEKYQEAIKNAPPGAFKEKVFSVCGRIIEITQKDLILGVIFYPASPIENPEIEKSTVKLTNTTEIVKQVEKSLVEQKEYQETDTETVSDLTLEMRSLTPPEFLKEIPISFSELKAGDEIFAVAEEDIKNKSEFFAQKIILRFLPER
jgi:hypothetical protein